MPVIGRFDNGVGTFYADDTLRGRPIQVRYLRSRITPTSCQWEQPFRRTAQKTRETNWYTFFTRIA